MMNVNLVRKKIGKFSLLILLCLQVLASAQDVEVTLVLKDVDGGSLEHAAVGVPFIAEVVIQGLQGDVDAVNIAGIEKFVVNKQGVTRSVRTVNGVTASKLIHRFAIRIDSAGTYQLGPITVKQSGAEYVGRAVRLQVGKKKLAKQQESVEIRLLVDKPQVVAGESTQFRIRFYPDEGVSLSQMSQPEFEKLEAGNIEGPYSGYEPVNGKNRYYLEWHTTIVTDTPGKYLIPAITAEYKTPRRRGSLLEDDFFASLFSRTSNYKRVTSNSIGLVVKPLPETKEPVVGVGVFSDITISVDPRKARMGEGIVLKLELVGSENMNRIAVPPLRMPQQLKYYDSKSYLLEQKKADGQQTKIFEYIVQGLQEGSWTVPEQKFTYYNLNTHSYQTLTTQPIVLEMLPAEQKAQPSVSQAYETKEQLQQQRPLVELNGLLEGPVHAHKERQLPYWLFVLLLMLPCIGFVVVSCLYLIKRYQERYLVYFVSRGAFSKARTAINKACTQKAYGQLYGIFKQLFTERYGLRESEVTDDLMLKKLIAVGATQQECDAFEAFLLTCASVQYAAAQTYHSLEEESLRWLQRFEELL